MVAGDLVWRQGTRRVYAGPLAGGARAVALANFATPLGNQYPATNVTVFWSQVGLQPGQRCRVRDLYAGEHRRAGGRVLQGGGGRRMFGAAAPASVPSAAAVPGRCQRSTLFPVVRRRGGPGGARGLVHRAGGRARRGSPAHHPARRCAPPASAPAPCACACAPRLRLPAGEAAAAERPLVRGLCGCSRGRALSSHAPACPCCTRRRAFGRRLAALARPAHV